MRAAPESSDEYQVGGSLPETAPTYVVRQADSDLYQGLKVGKFCHVLNSRQMGKSSLQVQTMRTLKREGFACTAIEMRDICSYQVTQDEFYGGFVSHLMSEFDLEINPEDWWYKHNYIAPSLRLSRFVEEELLEKVNQNIIIFVDEIDNALGLNFKDDFFAFIRACYNKRADKPKYNRLTFALLGVATPADLITDKIHTPFNIGQTIELTGFELDQATPLERGLVGVSSNPKAVLEELLKWTGGQPFLTQWLCQLVCKQRCFIPVDGEADWVEQLVRSQMIEKWLTQDQQQHLQTIRDRILRSEKRAVQLLGLYQQILQKGEVAADGSPEQMELRLSGLIVEQESKLRVYNRIYASIFDLSWVNEALSDLRPYAESLKAWKASNYEDESRLLRGQSLRTALAWAEGKTLSSQDYQFLYASQALETRKALQEAKQQIHEARQKTKQQIRLRSTVLATMSLIWAIIVVSLTSNALKTTSNALTTAQIQQLNLASENYLVSNQQLEALIASVRAGRQLQGVIGVQDNKLKDKTVSTLQRVINTIVESNRLEGHDGLVNSVSFSPDGKTIASASEDKTVKLWSRDGKELTTLKGHKGEVNSVSFSPDGKTIASASEDKTVKLWSWDGKESKELPPLTGHTDKVNSVSFSPDGKIIASASGDGTVKLWKRDSSLLTTFTGHSAAVTAVSFSPDGQTIASTSEDRTVKLWKRDGKQSKELTTLAGHKDKVSSVSFSPDGKMIATASSDKTINLWNQNGALIRTLEGHTDQVWSVSSSPDGKMIATASSDKTINLWNQNGALIKTLEGHTDRVTSVSFSQDGQTLSTSSFDKTIRLWKIGILPSVFQGHADEVYSVTFSPNGKTIASASADHTAKLWSLDGKELATLRGHADRVWSVRFSPNGKTIATASWDHTIKLWSWDGKQSKELTPLVDPKGNTGSVFSISFSPDGQTLASTGSDKIVRLWSLLNNDIKKQWDSGHKGNVVDVSFSPDGQKIATASDDKTVKLWNLDGTRFITLSEHGDEVNGVSFSPDSKKIATASDDRTVKLWNQHGKLLVTLKGHDERVMNVRFSPKGDVIATASFDKTVKIWKLNDTLLQTFSGHKDWVWDVSFSPDSKTLASASKDKTIRLWPFNSTKQPSLNLDDLLTDGCNWLRNYLETNPRVSDSDRHLCVGTGLLEGDDKMKMVSLA